MGLGFAQYSQDYDERLPIGGVGNAAAVYGWGMQIYPYIKSNQIYKCPSDTTTLGNVGAGAHIVSYGYNMNFGSPSTGGLNAAIAAFPATSKTVMLFEIAGNYAWVDRPGVTNESSTGLTTVGGSGLNGELFDGGANSGQRVCSAYATGFMGNRSGTLATMPGTIDSANAHDNSTFSGKFLGDTGRHLEGANFLMVDGHVKWYRGSSVSSGRNAPTSASVQGTNTAAGTSDNVFGVTFSVN